jgi:hypothetical protein
MAIPFIKFCVPCYDKESYDRSLARACYATICSQVRSYNHTVAIQQGTIIEECRNLLINESKDNQALYQKLNSKYTHFLFTDHDNGWLPEHVDTLLKHDKDIIGGVYRPKNNPNQYVAGHCDDNGRIVSYITPDQKGLMEVDWLGGGFILCKREALERMRYPWFWKNVVTLSNRAMLVGEDVYFCINARDSGLTVWLDADVILNHESNRYGDKNASLSNSAFITGDDVRNSSASAGRENGQSSDQVTKH